MKSLRSSDLLLIKALLASTLLLQAGTGKAAETQAELAKKLSNPIANLISMPVQYNRLRDGLGPNNVDVEETLIQPVIPIRIDAQTNVISRTILPIISYDSPAPGINGQSGIGDVQQSFFYSPVAEDDGWVWGARRGDQHPQCQQAGAGQRQMERRSNRCGALTARRLRPTACCSTSSTPSPASRAASMSTAPSSSRSSLTPPRPTPLSASTHNPPTTPMTALPKAGHHR